MDENGKKKFRTYRDLNVWQKSMKLVARVYTITREMPREEQYGLAAEIRKCVFSIPSSIAEGYGRRAPDEYKRLLGAAIGFVFALETQLLLATELELLPTAQLAETYEDASVIARMLKSLISKLSQQSAAPAPASVTSAPMPAAAGSRSFGS
jgi:four helix bundle protein